MLKNYKRKTFRLIDMSVPTDNNISVKEYNKTYKYKDQKVEIEHMWQLKTTTMPIIVGALGMIKKGSDKHINRIADNPNQYEIQKNLFPVFLISLKDYNQCE